MESNSAGGSLVPLLRSGNADGARRHTRSVLLPLAAVLLVGTVLIATISVERQPNNPKQASDDDPPSDAVHPAAAPNTSAFVTVDLTGLGRLRGIRQPGYSMFLGVRYAEPMSKKTRWRDAEPVKPWSGMANSLDYGASCASDEQGNMPMAEDCE